MFGAAESFSFGLIWSAILSNHGAVLSQISMKERPSTIAAFIHVITRHQILSRKFWHFLAILDLHSVFGNLSERDCVAGAAVALVPVFIHEIITSDVSPVEVIR